VTIDPDAELRRKLERISSYAIEKAGVTDAGVFAQSARETFREILDRIGGDREEGSPAETGSEIFD
jgi:hypothetical protein